MANYAKVINDRVVGWYPIKESSEDYGLDYPDIDRQDLIPVPSDIWEKRDEIEWTYKNNNFQPYISPPLPLEAIKKITVDKIQMLAENAGVQFIDGESVYQLTSWQDKAHRAERVLAGDASQTDHAILETEAHARGLGESVEQLAAKQMAKADGLAQRTAMLDGLEKATLIRVDAATDVAALDAVLEGFKAQLITMNTLSVASMDRTDARKMQAHRHMVSVYPEWRQLNILRSGTRKEIARMGKFLDACRAWSNDPNAPEEALAAIQP